MTIVRRPFKIQRNISRRGYLTIEAIREIFRWKRCMYILRSRTISAISQTKRTSICSMNNWNGTQIFILIRGFRRWRKRRWIIGRVLREISKYCSAFIFKGKQCTMKKLRSFERQGEVAQRYGVTFQKTCLFLRWNNHVVFRKSPNDTASLSRRP
jgi:hypothetical protein